MKKGIFITFEGPEGSGKSTHSKLICNFLKEKGFKNVLYTREPGGTKIGEKIRQILLDRENKELSDNAELLLYMASRAQIVDEVILPSLKKGCIVICDRFHDATIAYQGYAGGMDIGFINYVGRFATRARKPDLTILLDIPTDIGLYRSKRKDRMEEKSIRYHRKVRLGYLKLAILQPKRIEAIRVEEDIAKTQDEVRKAVMDFISKKIKRQD